MNTTSTIGIDLGIDFKELITPSVVSKIGHLKVVKTLIADLGELIKIVMDLDSPGIRHEYSKHFAKVVIDTYLMEHVIKDGHEHTTTPPSCVNKELAVINNAVKILHEVTFKNPQSLPLSALRASVFELAKSIRLLKFEAELSAQILTL